MERFIYPDGQAFIGEQLYQVLCVLVRDVEEDRELFLYRRMGAGFLDGFNDPALDLIIDLATGGGTADLHSHRCSLDRHNDSSLQ